MRNVLKTLSAPALASALAATALFGIAATPAQAQSQAITSQNFGLTGIVREAGFPKDYVGEVRITCEADPAQTAAAVGPVGTATKGTPARLTCSGPIKVEGYVEKNGNRTTCIPFQYREPSSTDTNYAQYQSVKDNGGNVVCSMVGYHM